MEGSDARGRRIKILLVAGLLACAISSFVTPCFAQPEDVDEDIGLEAEGSAPDAPIAIELARGVDLLSHQIADQKKLLKTAQTDREQQLIRKHLRVLQKERRSLESLLHRLVGPDIDLLEEIRERQEEISEAREEVIRDLQD